MSKSPKLRKVIKNYIYYNGTGIKDNISVFSKDLIFTLSDVKEELTSGDLEGAWIDFGATLGLHRAAVSFKAVYQGNHQYYVYGIVGDKYKFRESDTNYRSFLGLLNAMGVQWERRGSISPTNEFIEFQFIIEVPDE